MRPATPQEFSARRRAIWADQSRRCKSASIVICSAMDLFSGSEPGPILRKLTVCSASRPRSRALNSGLGSLIRSGWKIFPLVPGARHSEPVQIGPLPHADGNKSRGRKTWIPPLLAYAKGVVDATGQGLEKPDFYLSLLTGLLTKKRRIWLRSRIVSCRRKTTEVFRVSYPFYPQVPQPSSRHAES